MTSEPARKVTQVNALWETAEHDLANDKMAAEVSVHTNWMAITQLQRAFNRHVVYVFILSSPHILNLPKPNKQLVLSSYRTIGCKSQQAFVYQLPLLGCYLHDPSNLFWRLSLEAICIGNYPKFPSNKGNIFPNTCQISIDIYEVLTLDTTVWTNIWYADQCLWRQLRILSERQC